MIRFDTRDKKPKLYDLLILSAIVAVILGVLLYPGVQTHRTAVCVVLGLYYLAIIVRLITAFFGQLEYNPYSYNTIIYAGFALFILYILIMHIVLSVKMSRYPDVYMGHEILRLVLNSAKTYMFWTSPFLLVFSAALCVSNVSLIRHEGMRFVNVLGIILSALLVGGFLFLFFFDFYVSGSEREVMIHDLITNTLAAFYLYFECMLIGAIIANAIAARYEPERNKDFLIILGCGIQKDGKPTPLLRGRIDKALEFAKEQKEQTGKELIFITSGGKGPDECISESASMKQYLLEKGVEEERIIEEDRSTDTAENMRFSKEKIMEIDPDGKIAFSTTTYHVFRSGIFARRVKMRAVGMGAKTRWYFWPNAAVREFIGLLSAHRIKQGVILGSMIVAYILLTLLAYR